MIIGTLTSLFLVAVQEVSAQGSVTDYAPQTNVQCPDLTLTPLVRQFTTENQTLNTNEIEYINARMATVLPDAWKTWLGGTSSRHGYNVSAFQGNFPKIGMAIPGGGLRAALYGAGALNALDVRNDRAKTAGTGGLLQVTSYLSGLSGGSWVTGSMYFNNWLPTDELVLGSGKDGRDGWLLDLNLVLPDDDDVFSKNNQHFYGSILSSVVAKAQKGFDTSLTDPWSRTISFHFLNGTTQKNFFTNDSAHGAGQLWSSIPLIPAYQQHQTPFPLIVANSRPSGSNSTGMLDLNSTVYEITPYELASYDPSLSAAFNLTYAGTQLTNGHPANGSACVRGFDQAGFIMGTSASLFNSILDVAHNTLSEFSPKDAKALSWILQQQLQKVRTRGDDVANWPNPFTGLKNATFQDTNATILELIDGASNGANIPYDPLFVRARALDVIVTLEGSADIVGSNWPNGSSLITTSTRLSTLLNSSHQQFPPIPSTPKAFIETGVSARATFFGCNPQHIPSEYPLIIYLPNAPPINGDDPVTNTLTFQLSYTRKHQSIFLSQVYNNIIQGFTPNATTPDANFGSCLQCAAIDRARLKVTPPVQRSEFCTKCFTQYCYDPDHPPSQNELPGRHLSFVDPNSSGFGKLSNKAKFGLIGGLIGGFVLLIAALTAGVLFWRRRKKAQRGAYHRVDALHNDSDASPWRTWNHDGSESRVEYHELPFREH